MPLFPIPFLPRLPRRIGPLACSYPCRLRPGHIQSGGYSVFKVHCARIVRPALQKQQAKKWPLPKSKSEVSCGFAESQVFRFPSHKRRKALKTLDFPRRSKNGPSFQKFFVFFCFPLWAPHCTADYAETPCHGVAHCKIEKPGFMRVCRYYLH